MNYKTLKNNEITKLLPIPISIKGKGVINDVINNLPFELHVPGYQYLGPGTNLDLKQLQGVKPKNKLDQLAMEHDTAYSKSNDMSDRHNADYALQEGAWNCVLSKDAGLGEKAAAWLTTNVMKAKRALGAGLLTKYPVSLNEIEQKRLAVAVQTGKSIYLTLDQGRTKTSVMNETYLPLTATQITNLKKGKRKIRLSIKQLKKIKSGGFLPALAAATVPALISAVPALINAYQNKKANNRLVEKRIRHNREMEKKSATGKGVYINKKPVGKGVYINRKPTVGNGLLETLF